MLVVVVVDAVVVVVGMGGRITGAEEGAVGGVKLLRGIRGA